MSVQLAITPKPLGI